MQGGVGGTFQATFSRIEPQWQQISFPKPQKSYIRTEPPPRLQDRAIKKNNENKVVKIYQKDSLNKITEVTEATAGMHLIRLLSKKEMFIENK